MKRFVLDACTIHVGTITTPSDLSSSNIKLLGLTNGGVTINAVPDVREIEFDGKRGRKIKDMNRILGWNCSIETKGLELNEDCLTMSLIEKVSDFTDDTYEKFRPSNNITYKDLVVVGQLHGTEPMVVVLKNCFNEAGFALETSDSSEGTYSLTAYANYEYDPIKDAKGTNYIPMEIYLPKADGAVVSVSLKTDGTVETTENPVDLEK